MCWFWTILIVAFVFVGFALRQRALSRCPRCGWSNPSDAEYCTNCGIPLKTEKEKDNETRRLQEEETKQNK